MTLLGVYVIVTYHVGAERSQRSSRSDHQKITGHRIDADYIAQRLQDLAHYHQDTAHWNQREITEYLPIVIDRTIEYYPKISAETGVPLKNLEELIRRRKSLLDFQALSRLRAAQAQKREQGTPHPHERSRIEAKSAITITNFFNGEYYFTVDEAHIKQDSLFLIEKKHSKGILPASSDIKDGLLKLVLYHNLESATVDERSYRTVPVLGLTSDRIVGYAHSAMHNTEIQRFWDTNSGFGAVYRRRLLSVFNEANQNDFRVYLSETRRDTAAQEAVFLAI